MIRVNRNINYKLVIINNSKQPQAVKLVNGVCAYKLLVVGPLTMKLGTLIRHDKEFSETENTRL